MSRKLSLRIVYPVVVEIEQADNETDEQVQNRALDEADGIIESSSIEPEIESILDEEGDEVILLTSINPNGLTDAQINFFEVEIANEIHGGVSPATLDSAWDSLIQAPNDVIAEWCLEDSDSIRGKGGFKEFKYSIQELHQKFGGQTKLIDLLELSVQ